MIDEFQIQNASTYVPIEITLSAAPATSVTLNFNVDYDYESNDNTFETDPVTFTPTELTFEPWVTKLSFTTKIAGWDFNKADTFDVSFTFTGTDADAFYSPSNNKLTFTVVRTGDYTPNPQLTLDTDDLDTDRHSWATLKAQGSGQGYIHCLVLPKDIVAPSTGA